jgi:hypothetical protein
MPAQTRKFVSAWEKVSARSLPVGVARIETMYEALVGRLIVDVTPTLVTATSLTKVGEVLVAEDTEYSPKWHITSACIRAHTAVCTS